MIILVGFFLPQQVWQTIEVRANFLKKIESGGMGNANVRFAIWGDYIREIPKYVLTGVGFQRSKEATKESFTTRRNWIPHNRYLHTLVEFGFIGFLLFMGELWQLWKRVSCRSWQMKISVNDSVILGFFSACLVMLLFGSYSGSRDLWIFLGVVAAYGSWKVKTPNMVQVPLRTKSE